MSLRKITAALGAAAGCLAGSAMAQDPVVLVHGYTSNASTWDAYRGWFAQDGIDTYAASYDWTRSNRTSAVTVGSWVNDARGRFGASKVDLVGHSMGALNSRYYLKFLGGTSKVDDWMSIAGVNYGTALANLCAGGILGPSCADLAIGSDILEDLNRGDDTPGRVRYGAAWSWCDGVILPAYNSRIAGGSNRYVGCVGHNDALRDARTYRTVRDFVR